MSASILAIVLGTLVSEDLTAVAAGLLVQRGEVSAAVAVAACTFGIYVGDLALWIVGRVSGPRVLRWRRLRRLLPDGRIQQFAEQFDRHTAAAILGSRLAPGTRLPLYVLAGAAGSSFARFAGWSFAAVIIWTPALVLASALAGQHIMPIVEAWGHAGPLATAALAAMALAAWRSPRGTGSRRRLQRITARLSRLWRWEFWPMWLFYAPVGAWIAWLAMKHGGLATITAANPGITDGGVVGESKFEILRRLPRQWTVASEVLEPGTPGERLRALHALMTSRGWTFPLVLKPDVGQRGTGVRIIRSTSDAGAYLAHVPARIVAQPYHPGPCEAGVFYWRQPGTARGRILCITDKVFPVVTGDGRSPVDDLIWAHPRYRMQAATFLARLGPRAGAVPGAGERVPLGLAGNHAQGAMFLDGRHLISPALEARIDEIARAYDGFYIGRFDVRYSDPATFVDGRDFAIVELNGATAECTNIYDPRGTLIGAYRQLFRQWRLVFEVGAANRRAGEPVSSTRRLIRIVRTHLSTPVPLPVSD